MTRRLVVVLLGWLTAVVGGRDLVLAKPADKAGGPEPGRTTLAKDSTAASRPARPGIERFTAERNRMIEQQLISRGIRDPLVIGAMRSVPRHLFVPTGLVNEAYDDNPLPIGHEQTISQPYIVAFMTEALGLTGGEKVLEVGTGSGYQAAVLAEIVDDVYTIEIVESLGEVARDRLARLHYGNVHVRIGDGYRGWPEEAPFDAIIVTAAPDHIPKPLIDQLAIGGRLVLPVGDRSQELIRVTRTPAGIEKKSILPVRFVPMTGEARDN
jgi:protein-L-isoaspartate(D-aspartate) O-methyltransferase